MPATSVPNKSLSIKKRARQNRKLRIYNRAIKSRVKSFTKALLDAVNGGDKEQIETALRAAVKEISKSASKGVLHKNTASRKISKLSKLVHRTLNKAA